MDLFFQEDHVDDGLLSSNSIFWSDHPVLVPVVERSAFAPYLSQCRPGFGRGQKDLGGAASMNKRMIEFMRRTWPESIKIQELDRERGYRHMLNERMRREKQKNSYSALHSLLPHGTKIDKNSIVQGACKRVEELLRCREGLQKRNWELLKATAADSDSDRDGGTKIRVRIANPSSGVYSMLEILKCLERFGIQTTSIQSKFSSAEFAAVIQIQNEIEAAMVEKVIQTTLFESERKLLHKFQHG